MSARLVVNERDTVYIAATFTDANGNAATPTAIKYGIRCETTGTEVRAMAAWGGVAASSVTIQLLPADARIISAGNRRELRRVTVIAEHGTNVQKTEVVDFEVVNLAQLS